MTKHLISWISVSVFVVFGSVIALRTKAQFESHSVDLVESKELISKPTSQPLTPALELELAAEKQIGITTKYDSRYTQMKFPGGDVAFERGVCSDVVVRALRTLGTDLQVELNKDMKANFGKYPQKWGLKKPDPNIDHRRVPNLMYWFERKGLTIQSSNNPENFKPGDIVSWALPMNKTHIGIVSRHKSTANPNTYLIIHNIGSGAQLEDCLFKWPITGIARISTKI